MCGTGGPAIAPQKEMPPDPSTQDARVSDEILDMLAPLLQQRVQWYTR